VASASGRVTNVSKAADLVDDLSSRLPIPVTQRHFSFNALDFQVESLNSFGADPPRSLRQSSAAFSFFRASADAAVTSSINHPGWRSV